MSKLSSDWNNEAYVSLHLVQEMLRVAGLSPRSGYSHWIPEFRIESLRRVAKKWRVDFCIEDLSRHINFLVEVKSAANPIDDAARFQLRKYLEHSNKRFGLLIDPFTAEMYEYTNYSFNKLAEHRVEDVSKVKPVANFLWNFLESIKMRTISIHTSKGGVGKTTLVINIAYELARMGNRVLVIDLDEQANASLLLGVNKAEEIDNASSLEEIEQILDSFAGRKELVDFLKADKHQFRYQDYIYHSKFNNFMTLYDKGHIDVLPSSYRTKDTGLGDKPFRDRLLNQGLQSSNMAKDYDYIIIDTPPSYTDITWNGVSAAQYMIIPSQMEYLSAYGINNPIKQVKEVEQNTDGKRGKIIGIVPMMANNTNLYKTIKQLIQIRFKHIPILQEIKDSTYVGESLKCRNPMTEYAQRTGKGQDIAYQFQALTQQIIENINTIEKTESN